MIIIFFYPKIGPKKGKPRERHNQKKVSQVHFVANLFRYCTPALLHLCCCCCYAVKMKVFRNNFAIEKNVLMLNLLQFKCYLFFSIQTCILISNKKITPRHSLINEFKTNCARDCGLFTMTYFVGCVLETF